MKLQFDNVILLFLKLRWFSLAWCILQECILHKLDIILYVTYICFLRWHNTIQVEELWPPGYIQPMILSLEEIQKHTYCKTSFLHALMKNSQWLYVMLRCIKIICMKRKKHGRCVLQKKEICWYRDECVFRLQSCKQQGKKKLKQVQLEISKLCATQSVPWHLNMLVSVQTSLRHSATVFRTWKANKRKLNIFVKLFNVEPAEVPDNLLHETNLSPLQLCKL